MKCDDITWLPGYSPEYHQHNQWGPLELCLVTVYLA